MTKNNKADRLRELIAKGAVLLPGVPNAAIARQVERTGFDAVYVSGAGMANATAGVPDIGLLSLTEIVTLWGKACTVRTIKGRDTQRPLCFTEHPDGHTDRHDQEPSPA